ncbi:MAG: TniB family NTP-binding protein [Hyphomicrobiales bacterium]|nr:TniB family NTP-binding protein [Rhodoblastus sp.]MCC2103292.1 TniB family NTP-binding protein [Hyphomicrobiales bacterium]MCC2106280.1 TniB family NTP-binding protein [Hyphomicrobiales bacterium]
MKDDVNIKKAIEEEQSAEDRYNQLTLDRIIARFPERYNFTDLDPNKRKFAERVASLNLLHYPSADYKRARGIFNSFVAKHGNRDQLLAIYGASQSGKTHILTRLREHKDLEATGAGGEGEVRPLLMVNANAPCTLKGLGWDILCTIKDIALPEPSKRHEEPDYRNTTAPSIWREVRSLLFAYRTRVLIIDEIHNVLVKKAKGEIKDTAMAVKSLIVNEQWPVIVVISGTPAGTKKLIDSHLELRKRAKRVEILPIGKGDPEMAKLLEELEKQLNFPKASGLSEGDMPLRFYNATTGHRGKVARFVREAAEYALEFGNPSISNLTLARMWREGTGDRDRETNPFLQKNPANAAPSTNSPFPDDDDEDEDAKSGLRGNGRHRPSRRN